MVERVHWGEGLVTELQPGRWTTELIVPGYEWGFGQVPVNGCGDFGTLRVREDSGVMLVIGDVAGHDKMAARLARLTETVMGEIPYGKEQPKDWVLAVNQELRKQTADREGFEGRFVTVLGGVLDQDSGRFNFARAGHPFPLVFDAEGKLNEMEYRNGQPLNVVDCPDIHTGQLTIPPGGSLWVFTDGVTEAPGWVGPEWEGESPGRLSGQEPYGLERLIELIRRHIALGTAIQIICDRVIRSVLVHQGQSPGDGLSLGDDITVMGLMRRLLV